MKSRLLVLLFNGLSLVGAVFGITLVGYLNTPRLGFLGGLPLVGVGSLLAAEVLFLLSYCRLAIIPMLLGGLLTLPVGGFSLLAARWIFKEMEWQWGRNTQRQVCGRCGYDLRTVTIPRCPECGCAIGFDKPFEELGLTEEELKKLRHTRHGENGDGVG